MRRRARRAFLRRRRRRTAGADTTATAARFGPFGTAALRRIARRRRILVRRLRLGALGTAALREARRRRVDRVALRLGLLGAAALRVRRVRRRRRATRGDRRTAIVEVSWDVGGVYSTVVRVIPEKCYHIWHIYNIYSRLA